MRVMHVLESTATGTLSVVCMIANRLAIEGHEVYVIFSVRSETPKNLASLFHPNVVLRPFQMKGRPLAGILLGLRREISSHQPDLVHLHSSFAGFLGRLSTLLCLRSATFFYSPHCISFMRSDISLAKKVCFAGLEMLACIKKCTYIGCSASECEAVRRYLHRRAVLVENAVDGTVAAKRGNSHGEGRASAVRRIVTVGGIRRQKDPSLFSEIVRLFNRKDIEFVWIGDGDPDAKQMLLDAGVTVTGWLSREAVLDGVKQADLYLSTSSWEGMPISLIEAMVLGTPVVASGCSGNVDIIRDADTGLIFRSAAEAVALLNRMVDDEYFRLAIATNAEEEARKRFSEDRFFNDLTALYAIQPPVGERYKVVVRDDSANVESEIMTQRSGI